MTHFRTLALAAVAGLAIAPAAGAQKPSSTDKSNAAKHCKSLRSAAGSSDNFRAAVDALVTGKVTKRNAYGKCVSHFAKDEAKERSGAQRAAVQACKAEREAAQTPEQKAAFQQKYGAKNAASAYGKCVSQAAKANKAEADANDKDKVNAARACKTERGTTAESRAAFKSKYRNFGKCVSAKAKELAAARKAA